MVRTPEGDLAVDASGVTFKPYALHGKAAAKTWGWGEVRRVAVEDGGRGTDRAVVGGLPLWGLLYRPKRAVVVVSVEDEDLSFVTRQPLVELRAAARRVLDDVPAAQGKVLV